MASSLVFVESPFGPGRLMLAPAGARLPAGVHPVTLLAVAGAPGRTSARGGRTVVAPLGAGRAAGYAASVAATLGATSPTRGDGVGGRAAGFAAASVVAALGTSSPAGVAGVGRRGAGHAASVVAAAVAAPAAGEPGDGDDGVNRGDKKPFYPSLPYHAPVSTEFECAAMRGLVLLDILVLMEQAYEPENLIASFDWADMCLRRVKAEGEKGFVLAEHVVAAMLGLQSVYHGLARRRNVRLVPESPWTVWSVPFSTTTPEAYFERLAEELERMVQAVEEIMAV